MWRRLSIVAAIAATLIIPASAFADRAHVNKNVHVDRNVHVNKNVHVDRHVHVANNLVVGHRRKR
jgi:UDP-3-O-[3-hydroxymyristoyl] glucosamine N-acyltransferase